MSPRLLFLALDFSTSAFVVISDVNCCLDFLRFSHEKCDGIFVSACGDIRLGSDVNLAPT